MALKKECSHLYFPGALAVANIISWGDLPSVLEQNFMTFALFSTRNQRQRCLQCREKHPCRGNASVCIIEEALSVGLQAVNHEWYSGLQMNSKNTRRSSCRSTPRINPRQGLTAASCYGVHTGVSQHPVNPGRRRKGVAGQQLCDTVRAPKCASGFWC